MSNRNLKIRMSVEQKNIDLGPHELANNILVDFCCMEKLEFTLAESADYHGIPLEWYSVPEVLALSSKGYFSIVEDENE